MKIVETQGRRSLTAGVWHKAEASQGATNCAAAKLITGGTVLMGDTQNPDQVRLTLPGSAWDALVRTLA
ncbi:DUF397 domain-containing protein [Nocardiopsis alba]|uniref:DUF397 domain-containing protein n=1 Tax=Nocardiopsis alba TaxID=53437 RepID=UPI003D763BD6